MRRAMLGDPCSMWLYSPYSASSLLCVKLHTIESQLYKGAM